MRITIMVEGETEKAFKQHLREYLHKKLAGKMPKLDFHVYNGRIPTADKLRRTVERLLKDRKKPSDIVIALTDVYTGKNPPDFKNAEEAKQKMKDWVGNESRFYPHVALHDFEAWLIPYWTSIQRLAGHNQNAPSGNPESINHSKPPSYHIKEIFERGNKSRSYNKPRDAGRILKDNGLEAAIGQCSELRSMINTILAFCGESQIS